MCLPFLNLSVRYDALLRGWCVAYVGGASVSFEMPMLKPVRYCLRTPELRNHS
jgi:hypothetical protein